MMICDPLISVIIPVCNVEPYLREALESVIHQTYKKLEILVIDDGSEDRSGVICDEYAGKDDRIIVLHQENKGLSSARNAGLDRMTGYACAFLDPDDAYENTFIEKLLAAMLEENADVTVCRNTSHQTEQKLCGTGEQAFPLGKAGNYDRISALRALADGRINVAVWNKLYRSGLWQEIRFPDGCVYEDIDTSFRIFNICRRIHVIDESLYLHRIRKGSITTTGSLQNFRDRYLACSHFASFITENIPDVFSSFHEQKWRKYAVNGMVVDYINYSGDTESEETTVRNEMRRQILSAGKVMGIETLGLRTRAAWHMVQRCPRLLKAVYRVYHPIRMLVLKTTGR